MAKHFTHLFLDEAHHVAAPTWQRIKASFADKRILQMTATPFRRDGKRVDGKIIYNYPMGLAQRAGFFRTIGFSPIEEMGEEESDHAIATKAIQILRSDLKKGLDHLVLARADSVTRADKLEQCMQG